MAGPLLQGYGLAAALRSRAALRPLGLLVPPSRGVADLGPGHGEAALEENPFYGKYRHKIQELRRSSPDVFESRMEKRTEVKKQPVGYSNQGEFIRCMEEKTLDSILNVEMVKEKSAEEIKQIWNQYFSAKDTVYAVIPAEKFDLIWERAQKCPSFLYALPRKEGYEFFVGQWSGTELHFTSLINVQTQGETAPSQLVLYHFPDLQKEKGIVLMTAEMDSKFLVVHEAQCLANQVQLFYATDRSETYELVETFNHRSSEFKYMSVIAELEQSGLGRELRPGQISDKSQS
ncbi:ATP synthase mitochondrial F1 complex assembly factor 1 isoform X3 [Pezoporus wallicus]|uniref:ATP synthase mitochondrial F1 complex assembly factor 1 isoform X3 n=1 Tax=Pezoporus wallicus TaxID=35540 RepID=UPI00254F2ABB|nr:ATP synthase mitochondrial F1 complex assembly factor 1 isoform X3 [Pezoporus wallicus]XP_061307316.1 ATP synthase mitochondrial F1 complex assembly factor 1 isoform X3 [Pezoporus flaviventris]